MSLGINKDLEPLARIVRRSGGAVSIRRSNHVKWTMPNGRVIWTGLTMSSRTAQRKRIEIRRALNVPIHA